MTKDEDYDALSQKQLASIKRDTRISFEDAAVRTIHKMLEPEQEPVARYSDIVSNGGLDPRNTVPQKREWVGLTDDEVDLMSSKFEPQHMLAFHSGMYMAQNILKGKNHD